MPFTSGTCTGRQRRSQQAGYVACLDEQLGIGRGPGHRDTQCRRAGCPQTGCLGLPTAGPASRGGKQGAGCPRVPTARLERDLPHGADGGARQVLINVLHILHTRGTRARQVVSGAVKESGRSKW